MRVKLSSMPDPKTVSTVTYSGMRGGLNLADDPVRVGSTQSPDMLNMWYRDGVLKKRPGQRRMAEPTEAGREAGHVWCYDKQFNGMVVYLDGTAIRYFDPTQDPIVIQTVAGTKIPADKPHGTFFAFDERLYYKGEGIYLRLSYEDGIITCENILWETASGYETSDVYTPIIAINRNADGTGGDSYQPENRINPKKKVWFDSDNASLDYYLPAQGCKVTEVQVGDDVVDTSDTSTRTFVVGGRTVKIVDEALADGSAQYTHLNFDVPLYINDSYWSSSDWRTDSSKGWNYLRNAVYSTIDLTVTENTEISPTETLYTGYGISHNPTAGLAEKYEKTFMDLAFDLSPIKSHEAVYFILDNGRWMNLFVFRDTSETEANPYPNIVSYDTTTSEVVMKNYFLVSYNYSTQEWTTQDFRGKTDSGWHYMNNLAYNSFNPLCVYVDASGKEVTFPRGTVSGNANQLCGNSIFGIGNYTAMTRASDVGTALDGYAYLIEETASEWVFVTCCTDTPTWSYDNITGTIGRNARNKWRIGSYYDSGGVIRAKLLNVIVTKIPKTNPLLGATAIGPIDYTVTIGNIIWSTSDLVWTTYNPGDIVLNDGGNVPEGYENHVDIALYRARRDYGSSVTGNYILATNGTYVTVYVDCGMELTWYDLETGEFKARGFVTESFRISDMEEAKGDVNLETPAVMSNQLRVTYTKDNTDAMKAIADCEYATSFGGSDAVCVVMGGCDAQPNSIFWSGNGSAGVDPTYFPMDQYNLCGTYQDPVTGFGKQQSSLIVFQTSHVSKASYSIDTIGERKYINLSLSTINSERGCDCPWSIALCGNNLAWMHTRHGIMYLKATTSAYENMVVVISENVNGSSGRPGLKALLPSVSPYACIGMEDGERYYAFVGEDLFVWDYSIYSVSDGIDLLSWSRHKQFQVSAATEADTGKLWIIDGGGGIAILDDEVDTDFGVKIPCRYTTPLEDFGGYYKLRNIQRVVLGLRSENGGTILLRYGGEGQSGSQKIDLQSSDMYTPIVVKPRSLRLHHFQLTLEGDGDDGGLEIMSVVTLYSTAGNTR